MDLIGKQESKIQLFESYLKSDPANLDLMLELGDLYHQAGRLADALASFERALARAPGTVSARSRIASVYLTQHRFADAATVLSALIAAGESAPALFHNLGIALFYQDRFADAAESFAAAGANNPFNAANFKYLAYALHHEGRLADATDACEKWIAAENSPESLAYLSMLAFDGGKNDVAASLAQRVLATAPDNADANAIAGNLAIEEMEMLRAKACFERALARQPEHGRAWLGLGLVHLHEQHNDLAIAAIDKAVALMPTHAGTAVTLGWAKAIGQDAKGAEAAFRQAIEADRGFAEAHGGLAVALVELDRVAEAKQAIQIADKLNAANFGSVYAKSLLLKREGKDGLAGRLISKALDRSIVAGGKPITAYLAALTRRQ